MRQTIIFLIPLFFLARCSNGQGDPSLNEAYCQCYDSVFATNGMDFKTELDRYINELVEEGVLRNEKQESWMRLLDSMALPLNDFSIPEPKNELFIKNHFICSQVGRLDTNTKHGRELYDAVGYVIDQADFSPTTLSKAFKTYVSEESWSRTDIQLYTLLIFSSVLDTDIGLRAKLPPLPVTSDVPLHTTRAAANVFEVLIDSQDIIWVEGEQAEPSEIYPKLTRFLKDTTNSDTSPSKYWVESEHGKLARNRGMVSLKNQGGTSYKVYVHVYNELLRAYNSVRDDYSHKYFKKDYKDLAGDDKKFIRKLVPIKISEAEPVSTD